jgi:hypothetical protein
MLRKHPQDVLRIVVADDQRHPDAHVEDAFHFGILDIR